MFDQMGTGRDLDHDAFDTAVHSLFHIVHHAAGETENLRTEIPFNDLLDRRFIRRGDGRHARLDPMHAYFSQLFSDTHFIVFREDHACLLFAVTERDIVNRHLLRGGEILGYFAQIVPRAHKPIFSLPGCCHTNILLLP